MIGIVCSLGLVCGTADGASVSLKLTRLDHKQRELATFCIQGWKEARDRLRSGVFSVRGRQFAPGTGQYPELDVPIEIFCGFDYDRDLFRYDARKPQRIGPEKTLKDARKPQRIGPDKTLKSAEGDGKSLGFEEKDVLEKFARGTKQAITWCNVNPLTAGFHTRSIPYGKGAMMPPLDVRILGIGLWHTVVTGSGYSDQCEFFSKWEMDEAADEGDGRYRCVWIHTRSKPRQEEVRHRVWFDERQGFSPIRSDVRINRGETASFPAEEFLQEESNATSVCRNGVWVPSTFSIRLVFHGRTREKRDLKFEWQSVNEAIEDEIFELAGMELPPDARVIDDRLATPVIVGRVAELQSAPPAPSHFPVRLTLVIVSVVVLTGLVILIILRRFSAWRRA